MGFNFNEMFVYDIANNHQGNIEHSINIINEMGEISKKNKIRGVFKFQFRQLETFIHPKHIQNSKAKHVDRFLSTRLNLDDYQLLFQTVKKTSMYAMCTPFDEESVDIIKKMGFDLIKIASCSAKDWPLLEKVAKASLPVIISTGGLETEEIDDVVSFFEHRGVDHAIMYCVSIYPIPDEEFHLNQIDRLTKRYPKHVIGWSTHEDPDNLLPSQIAISKGAKIVERHVGIENDKIKLNAYSSTPDQVDKWIKSCLYAKKLCGLRENRRLSHLELESINSLKRGVFLKKEINKNKKLNNDDIYFAMPYQEGQLESGQWKEGITLKVDNVKDNPVLLSEISLPKPPLIKKIKKSIHDVKAMLNNGGVVLNSDFNLEISHHYGLEKFEKIGAVIIDCVNRRYCKKIIIQLPGQSHPTHFHKKKEETFQIISGQLETYIDGHKRTLYPGQIALIQPGVWHSFSSKEGCVFEEISTTHFNDDSFYKDKIINETDRNQRKTILEHWGRFDL